LTARKAVGAEVKKVSSRIPDVHFNDLTYGPAMPSNDIAFHHFLTRVDSIVIREEKMQAATERKR